MLQGPVWKIVLPFQLISNVFHRKIGYWSPWLETNFIRYLVPRKLERRCSLIHKTLFMKQPSRAHWITCSFSAMKTSMGSFGWKISKNSQNTFHMVTNIHFPVVRGSFKATRRTVKRLILGFCDFDLNHLLLPYIDVHQHRLPSRTAGHMNYALVITEDLIKGRVWLWTIKTKSRCIILQFYILKHRFHFTQSFNWNFQGYIYIYNSLTIPWLSKNLRNSLTHFKIPWLFHDLWSDWIFPDFFPDRGHPVSVYHQFKSKLLACMAAKILDNVCLITSLYALVGKESLLWACLLIQEGFYTSN